MFMPRSTASLTLEQKVQFLMDEAEIRNIVYLDCRARSRCDVKLMQACFFDDALDHHQPFFDGPINALWDGFEEISQSAGEMVQYCAPQILIELDGDVARVESYVISAKTFHQRSEAGHKIVRLSGMRNLDRFERRNGEWRIAERLFIGEWGFFEEAPPLEQAISIYGIGTEPGRMVATPGLSDNPFARDRSDPSYHIK